jgi:hypothetical protein
MVDLKSQYLGIKTDIDKAISKVINSTQFINGDEVKGFQKELAEYMGVKHVITCGNGTDALQIAMMALGLKPGDEVITPSFTYIATTEVIGLLGLKPVFVDCDPESFNVSPKAIEKAITKKTKAIVPVHLFGQSCRGLGRKHRRAPGGPDLWRRGIDDLRAHAGRPGPRAEGLRRRAPVLGRRISIEQRTQVHVPEGNPRRCLGEGHVRWGVWNGGEEPLQIRRP